MPAAERELGNGGVPSRPGDGVLCRGLQRLLVRASIRASESGSGAGQEKTGRPARNLAAAAGVRPCTATSTACSLNWFSTAGPPPTAPDATAAPLCCERAAPARSSSVRARPWAAPGTCAQATTRRLSPWWPLSGASTVRIGWTLCAPSGAAMPPMLGLPATACLAHWPSSCRCVACSWRALQADSLPRLPPRAGHQGQARCRRPIAHHALGGEWPTAEGRGW